MAKSNTLTKRIARVERRVGNQKPEMKSITFEGNTTVGAGALFNWSLTNIAEGTSKNQRICNKIRVWRVEVRGTADPAIDWYLLQQKTTSSPTVAVFGNAAGAYIFDAESNSRWVEWKHYRNLYGGGGAGDSPLKFTQKWRNGIIVRYNTNTGTGVVNNGLILTALNNSVGAQAYNISIRVWYTDA